MISAGSAAPFLSRPAPVAAVDPARAASAGRDRQATQPGDTFGPAVIVDLGATASRPARGDPGAEAGAGAGDVGALTDEEQKIVDRLKARDREVRAHEQAHAAVGGQYAGSPSYTYQSGPDGKRYAIGGEVSIDTSPEKDPEATIRKMELVKRAALAPAEPSSQDVKVAQGADQRRAEALRQLERGEEDEAGERQGGTGDASVAASGRSGAAAAGVRDGQDLARIAAAIAAYGRDPRGGAGRVHGNASASR